VNGDAARECRAFPGCRDFHWPEGDFPRVRLAGASGRHARLDGKGAIPARLRRMGGLGSITERFPLVWQDFQRTRWLGRSVAATARVSMWRVALVRRQLVRPRRRRILPGGPRAAFASARELAGRG